MEPIKEQILAFADWNDEENGEAVLLLTDDNVERLASLPEGVLKAALRRLRESQSKSQSHRVRKCQSVIAVVLFHVAAVRLQPRFVHPPKPIF